MPIKLVKKEGNVSFKSNGIPMSQYNEQIAAKEAELEAEYGEIIENLEAEVTELKTEVAELESKIATMDSEHKEEIAALEQELEQKNERIITLEAEIETLRANVSSLESEVDELETEIEELTAQYEDCTGLHLTQSALTITGNCTYKFYGDTWQWFIEEFGDKIVTKDITHSERMFSASTATEIPFKLNFKDQEGINMMNMFYNCSKLTKIPLINVPNARKLNLSSFMQSCKLLRDANGIFENEEEFGAQWQSYVNTTEFGNHYVQNLFNGCYSLRTVPTWFYKLKLNPESTRYPYTTYSIYYRPFCECVGLSEIKGIPVWKCNAVQTKNMFDLTFGDCGRLKEITFEMNEDNTPIVTEWGNQTIDLSVNVGHIQSEWNLLNHNTGITKATRIYNADTYKQFKDHPDSWTTLKEYSRFNKTSLENFIASLPDTSAYLSSAGGSNTIKVKKGSGSSTDAGGVDDISEEMVALCTSKGWTLAYVA